MTRYALAAPARLAKEIRKSKFVANAANVASPEAAAEFLLRISDVSGSHNCWAWRIGQNYRFNDDGEPSGTAGKPILQALDAQQLDGVAIVVTRWFGGIKLGAGGLVRAYGGCAAECLRQAPKHEIVTLAQVRFEVEFAELALLRARLAACGAAIDAEEFSGAGAQLRVSLPLDRLEELRRLIADATRGRSQLAVLD